MSKFALLLTVLVVLSILVPTASLGQSSTESLTVLAPTEVYSEAGDFLRIAEAGEQFLVLNAEGDWIVVASSAGAQVAPVRIARDDRVELQSVVAVAPSPEPTSTAAPPTTAPVAGPSPSPIPGSVAQFPVPDRPWHRLPTIVIAARAGDPRIPMVHEAVAFWNQELASLGSAFRLGPVSQVVELAPVDQLIMSGQFGLEGGPQSPVPDTVVDPPGDLIVGLTDRDIVSFSTPPTAGRKVLVAIRTAQGPPLSLPNVARNVIAHEIGHGIGLGHNDHASYLMCGRPANCRPDAFRSTEDRYFPLTDAERTFLLRLYPATWQPRR